MEADSGCLIAPKEGVSEGMRLDLWRPYRVRRRGGGFLELKPQAEWVVPFGARNLVPVLKIRVSKPRITKNPIF